MFFADVTPALKDKDIFIVEYTQQRQIKFKLHKTNGIFVNVQIAKGMGTQNLSPKLTSVKYKGDHLANHCHCKDIYIK